jgi:starch-binding outer membrane protein, SusD/RagB family
MKIIFLLFIAAAFTACDKNFLDEKPNKALVTPTTLDDLQAMLDNDQYLNNAYPSLQEVASDNFYMLSADYNALSSPTSRAAYVWSDDMFNDRDDNDWSNPYIAVQYANIVLSVLNNTTALADQQPRYNSIKGSAHFYRAWAFFWQSQLFAQPYNQSSAATDPGIALRLDPGFSGTSVRASVEQSFQQIIADAGVALSLLPNTQPYKTRPNKAAAYGLLARVYLAMKNYPLAGLYADSCLQQHNPLLDFNSLNAAAANPVPRLNAEVVFQSNITNRAPLSMPSFKVDSNLFNSYHANDLRRTIFFKATGTARYFVGSFYGSSTPFAGITAGEMLLTRAEAAARAGNTNLAMNDVNTLLMKRFRTGLFTPLTASSSNEALLLILRERRKELIGRGLRWMDLRRLNAEPQHAVTITKHVNNVAYTLTPNDKRYTFIIPAKVIQLTGMPQTPR